MVLQRAGREPSRPFSQQRSLLAQPGLLVSSAICRVNYTWIGATVPARLQSGTPSVRGFVQGRDGDGLLALPALIPVGLVGARAESHIPTPRSGSSGSFPVVTEEAGPGLLR